jgi:aminopeptidase N
LTEVLNKSIEFYEKMFNQPYPFSKYDSVFVPEFNWGAMEHPGCVTFIERYIFKEPVSLSRKFYRDSTVAHELAHMWFGNLVTMEWWDDLWLNESFADYISFLCLSKINLSFETSNSWVEFNDSKQWGY